MGRRAIRICRNSGLLDFSLKICYIGSLKFGCYYLQYVPASKHFDHAWYEGLEAVTLCCTYPITGDFKESSFRRILDKFTWRAKPIRIIGVPDNPRPDKWSSARPVARERFTERKTFALSASRDFVNGLPKLSWRFNYYWPTLNTTFACERDMSDV